MENIFLVAILFWVAAIITLSLTFYTEGRQLFRYKFCKNHVQARLSSVEPFTISQSKGLVEKKQGDGAFLTVKGTEDKNANYPPFYHLLFERNRCQLCIEWAQGSTLWRAHYPFLKRSGEWRAGDTVELHYSDEAPWRYAIEDRRLLRAFWLKCAAGIVFLVCGAVLLSMI